LDTRPIRKLGLVVISFAKKLLRLPSMKLSLIGRRRNTIIVQFASLTCVISALKRPKRRKMTSKIRNLN
jgi:hypothetical protein